jgi:hypothetical protein
MLIRFYIPSFFHKRLIFPELITLYRGIYRIIYIFREWIRERLVFTEIMGKILYRTIVISVLACGTMSGTGDTRNSPQFNTQQKCINTHIFSNYQRVRTECERVRDSQKKLRTSTLRLRDYPNFLHNFN